MFRCVVVTLSFLWPFSLPDSLKSFLSTTSLALLHDTDLFLTCDLTILLFYFKSSLILLFIKGKSGA